MARLGLFPRFPYRERLPGIGQKYDQLLAELHTLPQDADSYGLIHFDFNDGNFTVDYDNGDITVFDFDDSCYFWFMFDLACAWEGGIGRTTFRTLPERRAFMDRYMEQVMAGYSRENILGADVAGADAAVPAAGADAGADALRPVPG